MSNKANKKPTNTERAVLELLWESGEPMTSTEIVNSCPDRNWKASYIHLVISSLLKKELIQVTGFKQTTKNYARTFAPNLTKEQYALRNLMADYPVTDEAMIELVKHALSNLSKEETLDTIIALCMDRKNKY